MVSYFHARETTINEETPGYFRSVSNDRSGYLAQMCNLGKAKLEKKLALSGVGEKKKV